MRMLLSEKYCFFFEVLIGTELFLKKETEPIVNELLTIIWLLEHLFNTFLSMDSSLLLIWQRKFMLKESNCF